MVFVCGTNAFNPMCRYYRVRTPERFGKAYGGYLPCQKKGERINILKKFVKPNPDVQMDSPAAGVSILTQFPTIMLTQAWNWPDAKRDVGVNQQ